MIEKCSVSGCERWADRTNLCFAHYYRRLRTGSTLPPEKPTDADRFFEKVRFTEDCWLWVGAVSTPYGHGNFRWDGKVVRAHRWIWEFTNSQIPPGFSIDHLCRIPNCVNPDHLEPVPPKINTQRGRTVQKHLPPTPRPIPRTTTDPVTRFLDSILVTEDDCWFTNRGTSQSYGHIQFKMWGKAAMAHRISYELFVEEIPDGMVLDHLCRTPACVNPEHLEPVTRGENTKRGRGVTEQLAKTHCPKGHEYSPENTQVVRNHRVCRACKREKIAEKRALERGPDWKPTRTNQNAKKTHCKYGHELSGRNLMVTGKQRRCRICHNATTYRNTQRRKALGQT